MLSEDLFRLISLAFTGGFYFIIWKDLERPRE
jgi:nitrate reductase NapE component